MTDDKCTSHGSSSCETRTDIVFALGLLFLIISSAIVFLFFLRRFKPPINGRSPILITISAVSSILLLFYASVRQKFFATACLDAYWVGMLLFTAALVPYLLRCLRLYFAYYGQLDRQTELVRNLKKERVLVYILLAVEAVVAFILGIVEITLSNKLDPADPALCTSTVSLAINGLGFILLAMVLVFIGLVYLLRKVSDEFNINNELKAFCFVCVCCLIPFFALQLNKDYAWPGNPYALYCLGAVAFFTLVFSVFIPLVFSFRDPRLSAARSRSKNQTGSVHASAMLLTSEGAVATGNQYQNMISSPEHKQQLAPLTFEEFLMAEEDHRKVWETYLARSFQLPLYSFYLEVQDFTSQFHILSDAERRKRVEKIVDSYIIEDSQFELSFIDLEIRKRHIYHPFTPEAVISQHMFQEVEQLVALRLSGETWQDFLRSQTYKQYRRQVRESSLLRDQLIHRSS